MFWLVACSCKESYNKMQLYWISMYVWTCILTPYIHVAYILSHATACHVQLVLGNYTNLQLHVSHATEFQLHATVAKPKKFNSDCHIVLRIACHSYEIVCMAIHALFIDQNVIVDIWQNQLHVVHMSSINTLLFLGAQVIRRTKLKIWTHGLP
jgi:hypothetical protein